MSANTPRKRSSRAHIAAIPQIAAIPSFHAQTPDLRARNRSPDRLPADDEDTATNPEPAGDDGDGDGDADAGTDPDTDADTDTASAAVAEREREPEVTPARATYEWSSGERACESCEASVRRRWRDGTAMVCRDCKSWE